MILNSDISDINELQNSKQALRQEIEYLQRGDRVSSFEITFPLIGSVQANSLCYCPR